MQKEFQSISFYQTLANREIQQQLFSCVSQKISNGGLAKEEFELVKNFIVSPGFDVEKLVQLNIDHKIIAWVNSEDTQKLVLIAQKGGDKND